VACAVTKGVLYLQSAGDNQGAGAEGGQCPELVQGTWTCSREEVSLLQKKCKFRGITEPASAQRGVGYSCRGRCLIGMV
jgi:hypothetical protein